MPETAPVSRRIPYDANGATVLYALLDTGDPSFKALEAAAPGSVADLNDEDNVALSAIPWDNGRNVVAIVLPEKWDLVAYMLTVSSVGGTTLNSVETSVDTTNGQDGTWVAHGSPAYNADAFGNYRDPTLWSVSGIKGWRCEVAAMNTEDFIAVHLWGVIAAGESPDRLDWVDDGTGLVYTVAEDSGDVPRGGSIDRDVRVRNLSATQTANSITISAESLFSAGGDDPALWYTFSLNGGAGPFVTAPVIASLGPGAEQVVTVRQVIPADDNPNKQAPRFKALPASWT